MQYSLHPRCIATDIFSGGYEVADVCKNTNSYKNMPFLAILETSVFCILS